MSGVAQGPIVVVEGIDGSGKSSTAREIVRELSANYPRHLFRLIDSDGISSFNDDQEIEHRFRRLEKLEHTRLKYGVGKLACLGAFTLARRFVEKRGRGGVPADLVVSVRDPLRISPATYAPILSPNLLGRLTPETRLRLLDRTTFLPPADLIVRLHADIVNVVEKLDYRRVHDEHENAADLSIIDQSLDAVLAAHTELFGTPAITVEALQTDTTAQLIGLIEPLIGKTIMSTV